MSWTAQTKESTTKAPNKGNIQDTPTQVLAFFNKIHVFLIKKNNKKSADILNHGGDSLRVQIALLFQLLPTKECENVFFYILKKNRIFIIDFFSTPSLVVALGSVWEFIREENGIEWNDYKGKELNRFK